MSKNVSSQLHIQTVAKAFSSELEWGLNRERGLLEREAYKREGLIREGTF